MHILDKENGIHLETLDKDKTTEEAFDRLNFWKC